MGPLLDAALVFQRRGWSVIPVHRRSKKPLIKWQEYNRRHATETEIRRWWKKWPNANVGIVTGKISGIVVVDADAKAQHLMHLLPDTPIKAKTGSGWFHFYYRYPPDVDHVDNVVRKDGFDVRADGGYVVAPPSLHASGGRYEWESYGRLDRAPIVPSVAFRSPSALVGSTNGAHPSHEHGGNGNGARETDKNWLSRVMQGVGHGERNDSATRLAGYYFGKHMPFDVVLSNLELWNQRNDPPLSESELVTVVRSVFGKEGRKPAAHTAKTDRTRPKITDPNEDPFALVPLSQYMTQYGGVETTWTVEGWLPDNTIALAVAPPGSYKTWIELDMAVSVATGTPFLDNFKVSKTGPVIIVQQEDFHGQMAERMGTIVQSRLPLLIPDATGNDFTCMAPPAPPIYLHPDRRLRFADDVVLEALEEKVAQIRPRLVIIDPLYSTGNTDDYLASTVNQMFALKTMRDRYGCSFLLAHHTAKSRNEGTDREASWGSQFVNAFLETGWQIRKKEADGEILVRRHFKASKDYEEIVVNFDISTVVPYKYQVSIRDVTKMDLKSTDNGHAILEVFTKGGAFSPQEVAKQADVHRTTAFRKLEKLVQADVLKKTIDGKYALMDDLTV